MHTPARELNLDPVHARRSNQLYVPIFRTAFGNRVSRDAAPTVWNSRPVGNQGYYSTFTQNIQV